MCVCMYNWKNNYNIVNWRQVERLLRAIYRPQNVYCIHVDLNSPAEVHAGMLSLARCFPNVFIASKLEYVVYAGFSRLQADINCMSDHVKRDDRWRYLINVAGEAFPLRTNAEIVKILKIYNGANDIEGVYGRRIKRFRYCCVMWILIMQNTFGVPLVGAGFIISRHCRSYGFKGRRYHLFV